MSQIRIWYGERLDRRFNGGFNGGDDGISNKKIDKKNFNNINIDNLDIYNHCVQDREYQINYEQAIELDSEIAHYLKNVMRRNIGNVINVFNAQYGEWQCEINTIKKNSIIVIPKVKISEIKNNFLVNHSSIRGLYYKIRALCPFIKNVDSGFIIQKLTEVGVDEIQPIAFVRSVIKKMNIEKLYKLRKISIEAAEQCGRLSIPIIFDFMQFDKFFKCRFKEYKLKDNSAGDTHFIGIINIVAITENNYDTLRTMISGKKIKFCTLYELKEVVINIFKVCQGSKYDMKHWMLNTIVGPEGGFDDQELRLISDFDACTLELYNSWNIDCSNNMKNMKNMSNVDNIGNVSNENTCIFNIYVNLGHRILRTETALILLNGTVSEMCCR